MNFLVCARLAHRCLELQGWRIVFLKTKQFRTRLPFEARLNTLRDLMERAVGTELSPRGCERARRPQRARGSASSGSSPSSPWSSACAKNRCALALLPLLKWLALLCFACFACCAYKQTSTCTYLCLHFHMFRTGR